MSDKPTPVSVLTERIEKLKAELAASEDLVAGVKAKQAAALIAADLEIDRERCNAEKLLQSMRDQLAAAAKKRETGQALIASGKKLLAEAAQEESEASEMDVGEAAIEAALQAKRDTVRFWNEELSRVQSSRARRKRTQLEADLEKLQRRVAAKQEPPHYYGSVSTDPILPCALCHQVPRMQQMGGAGDGDQEFAYRLGCKCGRGSTVSYDAMDRQEHAMREVVRRWNAQANDIQRAVRSRDALAAHKVVEAEDKISVTDAVKAEVASTNRHSDGSLV